MLDQTITTVLFDLDGTLLPMDEKEFTKAYFALLAEKAAPYGYEPSPWWPPCGRAPRPW